MVDDGYYPKSTLVGGNRGEEATKGRIGGLKKIDTLTRPPAGKGGLTKEGQT